MKNHKLNLSIVVRAKRSVPNMDGVHGYKLLGTLRFAQPTQCQFRQSGLTLLEIMITVVILSLGLLGLAGLQLTGLKNNRNAYNQTVAAHVVQDITERLRIDKDARALIPANNLTGRTIIAIEVRCSEVNPTFINRVNCMLSALPDARTKMTQVNADPLAYLIAVHWSDPQLNNEFGWGAGTTVSDPEKPDLTACGTRTRDRNCYYTWFRP